MLELKTKERLSQIATKQLFKLSLDFGVVYVRLCESFVDGGRFLVGYRRRLTNFAESKL